MAASPARESVHVRAPGKINVLLRVGALLEDGYHEVASAYQAVSLYEEIYAFPTDDFSMTVTGSVDISGVPTDGSNLAIRAARLLAKHTKYRGGVRFEVEKNVPVAGGMGGGSADAAAALVACDALWGTHLSRDELVLLASELGADVPFALMGGTAIGTGRGDRLSPALASGHFEWVIVLSDSGLSTPAVYAELDAHRARHVRDIAPAPESPSVDTAVLTALRQGDPVMLAESMQNDLQAAALHLDPTLVALLERGEERGALVGIVSGSGPTLAFLAEDAGSAAELHRALATSGLHVVRATGPVHGARVVE
jgi:4-diphosphocytidyl-2-C-methyl-D-erythritol kinase